MHNVAQEVEVTELVAGVGNHEAKSLLLLHMASTAVFHTDAQLHASFKNFIGKDDIGFRSERLQFDYCEESLEPIGQVVRGAVETKRGRKTGYAISDYGAAIGLSAAGLLLDWGLEYPDISVQQIFGPARSRTEVRAPASRIKLLTGLTANDSPVSLSEISGIDHGTESYHADLCKLDTATRALERHGMLIADRTNIKNSRSFIIKEIVAESAKSRRGIYANSIAKFISHRYSTGDTSFTIDDCWEAVYSDLKLQNPEIDPAYVRQRLNSILGSGLDDKRYKFLAGVERVDQTDTGKWTRLTISEAHREALSAIVEIVNELGDSTSGALKRGKAAAATITNDYASKQKLIDKAYSFSEAVNSQSQKETVEIVAHLMRDFAGPVSINTITEHYNNSVRRNVTPALMQRILRILASTERIEVHKERPKSHARRQANYYTLKTDQSS